MSFDSVTARASVIQHGVPFCIALPEAQGSFVWPTSMIECTDYAGLQTVSIIPGNVAEVVFSSKQRKIEFSSKQRRIDFG